MPGQPPVYDQELQLLGRAPARNTIGLPCGPTGIDERGHPCKEKLQIPRTHEFTAGAEREVVAGRGPGPGRHLPQVHQPVRHHETNRRWNASGTGLERIGSFRNGRNQTITNLGTPD